MTKWGWLRLGVAIGLVACSDEPSDPGGGNGDGLQVTSVQPADGATGVPWNATFEATLSAPLDPATVGPATVGLTLEGTPVPAVVSYDASSRTIRIAAPLLPGATYHAELQPNLRSVEGDSLEAGLAWTATTRAWEPAPVAGVGELVDFAVALGPSGSVHLFGDGEDRPWSDYATPYRKYISCASNCADPASWGRMAVDSAFEPLGPVAIDVDQTGGVHLMHQLNLVGQPIRYGNCPSDCLTPANWEIATVPLSDTLSPSEDLAGFAVGEAGRLHLVTLVHRGSAGPPQLRYATCERDCADSASWANALIPVFGLRWDASSTLTLDQTGRLHVIVTYAGVQSYATCPSDCVSPAQWSTTPADWPGADAFRPSLAVDAAGRVHLVFSDVSRAFTYARCEAECATPSSWATVRLDEGDLNGSALTVDAAGRITALNPVSLSGELRFLTCLSDCLEARNWQIATVDRPSIFQFEPPRLTLDPDNRLRLIYRDDARTLRYFE